jgi:hypothetical protein
MSRSELASIAAAGFGDMVKGVVDVARGIMAVGGELHADEEAALLADGSRPADLWGVNFYPSETGDDWLEFDSMINVRPAAGNRSRGVDDEHTRQAIRRVVASLVSDQ